MAANKQAGGASTEDKLRDLIRETFGSLMDEREKKSSRSSESKEQQWLRGAIREELGGIFEEFVRGYEEGEEGGAGAKGGDKGDEEEADNVFSIRKLLGAQGGR